MHCCYQTGPDRASLVIYAIFPEQVGMNKWDIPF